MSMKLLIIDTETSPWDMFTEEGRSRVRPAGVDEADADGEQDSDPDGKAD